MTALLLLIGFWLYAVLVFEAKQYLLPESAVGVALPPPPRDLIHGCLILISPDYWWAKRMKDRMACGAPRKLYVEKNNRMNLRLSLILAITCLAAKELAPTTLFFHLLGMVAWIRFVSRSWEIAYAFGRDVIQTQRSSTGLGKEERIKLALISYLEIFLYSMAAYTSLPTVPGALEALTLALNVGTLTNVGYAFPPKEMPLPVLMIFVQVFTTLSLVVLSIAAYLSRRR